MDLGYATLDLHYHTQAWGPHVTMSSHVTNLHDHVSQPTLQQLVAVLRKDFTLLKMGK